MAEIADALNYPYIRVRDVDWLKSTLLLFPHVARIRPARDAPPDDCEIEVFTRIIGGMGLPLLRTVEIDDESWDNQERLLLHMKAALEANAERLRRRFGQAATEAEAPKIAQTSFDLWGDRMASRSFQLHSDKVFPPLLNLLAVHDLVWDPRQPDGKNYVEMHPTVGEAVMASLAFACARSEGLRVITEFPEIYAKTIQRSTDDMFEALTADPPPKRRIPFPTKYGERLAEVVIYRRCDVSLLDAERLAALSKEHEALSDFRDALEGFAATIPSEMTNQRRVNSYLKDRAQSVIERWDATRRNSLPSFLKIFGDESEATLADLVKDGFKEAVKGAAYAVPSGHALLGAGAGLAIGLVYRMVKGDAREGRKEGDPLRYLSMLQDSGVGISISV